ncbi:MAG TPA: coniferyl aldehyde dehydrogenase [Aliidongia sp.]|nr:coniferyl aldehyde dehydrogenase [Aliidongia sp.]
MSAHPISPVTLAVPGAEDPGVEARRLLAMQRAAAAREGTPSYQARMAALDLLQKQIRKYRRPFAEAVSADFGTRSPAESDLAEIITALSGIQHTKRHLARWMKPQRRSVHWTFQPGKARVIYQPLGVVGVISPWNYPLLLSLGPIADALAAGNRVMLKPSEFTPRTSALLQQMLSEIFPIERVAVVQGGPDVAQSFAGLPFDHLLFTGSTEIGRRVMRAAADNLTPVTLELGGKSPVILCRDYPLKKAARMIALGKFLNAGQTCIAPDYALVPADLTETFAEAMIEETRSLYPAIAGNSDYSSIVSDRHYRRLRGLIDNARAAGARIIEREDKGAELERKLPPTVILGATPEMQVMREEIFGPILPVLPYADLDQAIAHVNAGDRPLALYCFSNDHTIVDGVLARTVSGGVTVNGTLMHCAQDDLPFGGVGPSGTGAYHGRDGFIRLSHARAVFEIGRLSALDRLAPPYGKFFKLVTGFLLGK